MPVRPIGFDWPISVQMPDSAPARDRRCNFANDMTKSPIINPATNRRAAFVTAAFRSLADIVVAHCAKDKLARPRVT
jgi:hypothetical protein